MEWIVESQYELEYEPERERCWIVICGARVNPCPSYFCLDKSCYVTLDV